MGQLNNTITDENLRTFETWREYDDAQDNFCEPDGKQNIHTSLIYNFEPVLNFKDEYMEKSKYVDLLANPERFTGYKGDHAHKIWNSIYKENCFE
jgi:ERO1-like protein alpha